MAKSNIRSIRFSDEIAELIDRQIGDTFTQKFENLVIRCTWELPAKEEELKRLEEKISQKRKQLSDMASRARKLEQTLKDMESSMDYLGSSMEKAAKEWS